MFNLRTFSHVLATVIKILLCSILYFEMYINSLNMECKDKSLNTFFEFVYSNKEKSTNKTKQNCC